MICKYRIVLSIDGGGIHGVVPLRLIDHLDTTIQAMDPFSQISTWADVFCSSSLSTIFTGALMLRNQDGTMKHSPREMLQLYKSRGKQIFSKNIGLNPEDSNFPLRFVLQRYFGDVRLNDLKNHFLFLSYDSKKNVPFPFTDTLDRFQQLPLSTAMQACSAQQGVFPAVDLKGNTLTDGMYAAKNPSKFGYDYARLFYPTDPIVFISLGTGVEENREKNYFEMEAEAIHEEMIEKSKQDRNLIYFRFQPKLTDSYSYSFENDQHSIVSLLADTDKFITENQHEFSRLMQLMEIRVNA
jgi:patatin-like phospholipase/acyl hydrolase